MNFKIFWSILRRLPRYAAKEFQNAGFTQKTHPMFFSHTTGYAEDIVKRNKIQILPGSKSVLVELRFRGR